MTREEAIKAMEAGEKVTHRYFTDNEYIHLIDGVLHDENGYVMRNFWNFRTEVDWETDWSIYISTK